MNYLHQTALRVLILLGLASTAAAAQTMSPTQSWVSWPTDLTARLEATALLQRLNVELLTSDDVKQTLERWCSSHRLVSNPQVSVDHVIDAEEWPTEDQRKVLAASANEPIRHRRTRVLCGAAVLLEADVWYLPSRVSARLGAQIEGAELPFDMAVQNVRFKRRLLSAALLWPRLPELSELGSEDGVTQTPPIGPLPARVLTHRVLLMLPNGTPFGEILENYTAGVLAFPSPSLPEIVVTAKRPRAAARVFPSAPM